MGCFSQRVENVGIQNQNRSLASGRCRSRFAAMIRSMVLSVTHARHRVRKRTLQKSHHLQAGDVAFGAKTSNSGNAQRSRGPSGVPSASGHDVRRLVGSLAAPPLRRRSETFATCADPDTAINAANSVNADRTQTEQERSRKQRIGGYTAPMIRKCDFNSGWYRGAHGDVVCHRGGRESFVAPDVSAGLARPGGARSESVGPRHSCLSMALGAWRPADTSTARVARRSTDQARDRDRDRSGRVHHHGHAVAGRNHASRLQWIAIGRSEHPGCNGGRSSLSKRQTG